MSSPEGPKRIDPTLTEKTEAGTNEAPSLEEAVETAPTPKIASIPENYSRQAYESVENGIRDIDRSVDANTLAEKFAERDTLAEKKELLHGEAWNQAAEEDAIQRLRTEIRGLETETAKYGARKDIEPDILQREAELRALEAKRNVPKGPSGNEMVESTQSSPEKTPRTTEQANETELSPIRIPEDMLEGRETAERGQNSPETAGERNLLASLSAGNKRFFDKMSEGGRKIMETLYETPVVNRIAGKLGIAYNQFWLDRHAKVATERKREVDILNLQESMLDKAKSTMASKIAGLKERKTPGAELIALQLNEIDRQKEALANKRDTIQSKLKSRNDLVPIYEKERDRIAEKLIRQYDERLAPMEGELEKMETSRDEMDLTIVGIEENHRVVLERLAQEEKDNKEFEETAREGGMSDKDIKKTLEVLRAQSTQDLADIHAEKERIETQRARINEKIAKVDAKANPYRDKRAEFARVTKRTSPELEIAAREREEVEPKDIRGVHADTRIERPTEPEAGASHAEVMPAETIEIGQERHDGRIEISSLINGWNTSLAEEKTKGVPPLNRTEQEYLLKTARLTANFKVDGGTFKKLLERYYKIKKVPKDTLTKAFDTFIKKLEIGK